MKTFVALATGMLLMASSCSEKHVVDFSEGQSVLVLNGQVAFDEAMGQKAWASAVGSKAGAEQQLPAMELGVYVLATGGQDGMTTDFSTTDWKNVAFTSDGAGNINIDDGDVTLRTGNTYDIYAYAPRMSDADLEAGRTEAGNVGNVRAIPMKHGDDVLWAKTLGVLAKAKQTSATLKFYHSGAQIGFTIKMKEDGTVVSPSTGVQLTVSGFYAKGMLDMQTGKMTLKDGDKTVSLEDCSGAKTNILIPAGEQMDLDVTVTDVPGQEGKTFTGKLPLVANNGESYLYDVNIDTDSDAHSPITFTPTIEEWAEVEAGEPLPIG